MIERGLFDDVDLSQTASERAQDAWARRQARIECDDCGMDADSCVCSVLSPAAPEDPRQRRFPWK